MSSVATVAAARDNASSTAAVGLDDSTCARGTSWGDTAVIKPQELRDHAVDDHKAGCGGRVYTCSCDYDKETERLLRAAAKRIDELEASNRGYREREALKREDEQDG